LHELFGNVFKSLNCIGWVHLFVAKWQNVEPTIWTFVPNTIYI
jgi:hypothetical protein